MHIAPNACGNVRSMVERDPILLSSQLLAFADQLHRRGKLEEAENLRKAAKVVASDPATDLAQGRRQLKGIADSMRELPIPFPKQ